MITKKHPKGFYQFILGMECETTGLCFSCDDPTHNDIEHHQAVSWGIIIADALTLKPIEKRYFEVKWNDISIDQRDRDPSFGKKAESIHGLTYEYLEKNGVPEEDVVLEIGTLIHKYWSPEECIRTLGHNVQTFDLPFLRDTFRRFGIELKFGSRHVDTSSAGFVSLTTWTSDELFELFGFETRKKHNALQDIEMALECARRIRVLTQKAITRYEE